MTISQQNLEPDVKRKDYIVSKDEGKKKVYEGVNEEENKTNKEKVRDLSRFEDQLRKQSLMRTVGKVNGVVERQKEFGNAVEETNGHVNAFDEQLGRNDERVNVVDGQLGGIKGHVNAFDEQLGRNDERVNVVDGQPRGINGHVNAFDEQLGRNDERVNVVDGQLGGINGHVNAFDEQLGRNDERVNVVDGQLGGINGHGNAFDGQLGRNDERVNAVNGQLGGYYNLVDDVNRQLGRDNKYVSKINGQLSKSRNNVDHLSVSSDRRLSRAINESCTINVLCFGDSLTTGNTDSPIYHPYTTRLQELLDKNTDLSERKVHVCVHNFGIDGETVHWGMKYRLPSLLKESYFDWVVILGGANDLAVLYTQKKNPPMNNRDPLSEDTISKDLKYLHKLALNAGSMTVAVTIPGRLCELTPNCSEHKVARAQINEKLRELVNASNGKVVLVDLDKKLSLPEMRRYWQIDVHYNDKGYTKMVNGYQGAPWLDGDVSFRELFVRVEARGRCRQQVGLAKHAIKGY
ncbi:predicted protein [Nematostella vectensis]|uniref:SGNH hydrolase-type esterase domain-containing protein n=1 Tax=Nematostella vectensis TaxID=45351 RepID=A7T1B4_NEMVE|nr:predicted protein [Nematostella vectensis]|eukprot:XP_001622355.1 predicted protein [Nematostella vectensis]